MSAQTILVHDCNDDVNFTLRLMLENLGYNVLTARSSADAMTELSRRQVDVVLTNRIHHRFDKGTSLPWMIRAIQPHTAIVLTNGTNGDDPSVPADAMLPKPFSLAQLQATIVAVTGESPQAIVKGNSSI